MPTFDSANNGKAVLNTKRSVLKAAYATEDGQKAIAPFVGPNPDFDKLPTFTIDAAFVGASELIKEKAQINSSSNMSAKSVVIHQTYKTDMVLNGVRDPIESANAVKKQQENTMILMAHNTKSLIG